MRHQHAGMRDGLATILAAQRSSRRVQYLPMMSRANETLGAVRQLNDSEYIAAANNNQYSGQHRQGGGHAIITPNAAVVVRNAWW